MDKVTDQVFINGLELMLSVGIYDAEKVKPQRVIINAVFDVDCNMGRALGTIQDVVSYEKAIERIKSVAQSRHYDLLEVLAEDIAVSLCADKRIRKIILSIEKPDIFDDAQSVGIRISRVFPA